MLNNKQEIMEMVGRNGFNITLLNDDERTEEVWRVAISNLPSIIQYMDNQTDELCKLALSLDADVLQFIVNQTDEICYYALDKSWRVLQYINNPSYELCKYALEKNPLAFEYIPSQIQTDDLCLFAVSNYGSVLKFIKNQNENIVKQAILNDPHSIQYTNGKQIIAFNFNYNNVTPIYFRTSEICQLAVNLDATTLQYLFPPEQTEEMVINALLNNPEAVRGVKIITDKIAFHCKMFELKLPQYLIDERQKMLNESAINMIKNRETIMDRGISIGYACIEIYKQHFNITDEYEIRNHMVESFWDIVNDNFNFQIDAVLKSTPEGEENGTPTITILINRFEYLFDKKQDFLKDYKESLSNSITNNRCGLSSIENPTCYDSTIECTPDTCCGNGCNS